MRVLFIGDMHLRIHKFSLATQFLSWVNSLIEKEQPDLVVNLGDACDTHAVIRSEIINELMGHIYFVLGLKIPYVYVKGNHDQYSPKDGKYHALLPFKNKITGLTVIDEPQDLYGMTFVPFCIDGKDFPTKTLPICVAHQTFLGADYGPVNSTEGVDAATISADLIIAGHIHKRHVVGKVQYVGSPYSQDASDVNQVKGVSVFDTDTWKSVFHRTPLPIWCSFKFELGGVNDADLLHKQLKERLSKSTDHWVIELTGPKAEIVNYTDSADYRKLVKNLSVRLKTVFTDKQKQRVSIGALSMEHILAEFVNKVYNGSLDKDRVLAQAKAILDEVKQDVR